MFVTIIINIKSYLSMNHILQSEISPNQRVFGRQPDGWFLDQFDQQVFWWQEIDGRVIYTTKNDGRNHALNTGVHW